MLNGRDEHHHEPVSRISGTPDVAADHGVLHHDAAVRRSSGVLLKLPVPNVPANTATGLPCCFGSKNPPSTVQPEVEPDVGQWAPHVGMS